MTPDPIQVQLSRAPAPVDGDLVEQVANLILDAERSWMVGMHPDNRSAAVSRRLPAARAAVEVVLDRIREGIEKLRVEWLNLSPDYKPDFDDALNAVLALLDEEARNE